MRALNTDVLIIGGGLSALSAAIEARKAGNSVLIVSKRRVGKSGNTLLSATNFSTVSESRGDSRGLFIEDTLKGGGGIGVPDLVTSLAANAEESINFLRDLGVEFLEEKKQPLVRLTPGHSASRTVCCKNVGLPVSVKGQSILSPLLKEVYRLGIPVIEWGMVVDLLVDAGRAVGAIALGREGDFTHIYANAVILACGAGGHAYSHCNNTREMTGDGLALAWKAGAQLRDLEFVQFFPAMGMSPLKILIPTTLFGHGAILRNNEGKAFLKDYYPDGEKLAGRDVMSRAIYTEIMEGRGIDGGVYLDLTEVPRDIALSQYSDLWRLFLNHGVELSQHAIRVGLTVHFFMGGVVINSQCETTLSALYGCGEVSGGIHGANRLGGNALLEAVTFGRIAGKSASLCQSHAYKKLKNRMAERDLDEGDLLRLKEIDSELSDALWRYAGVVRCHSGLSEGLGIWAKLSTCFNQIAPAHKAEYWWEVSHKLIVARLIFISALERTESRGAHVRSDYPLRDDNWNGSIGISQDANSGSPTLTFFPLASVKHNYSELPGVSF